MYLENGYMDGEGSEGVYGGGVEDGACMGRVCNLFSIGLEVLNFIYMYIYYFNRVCELEIEW